MFNPRVRKRTKIQRQAQCEELAEQYASGVSQKALAKKFNLSQSQVSKDLASYFGKLTAAERPQHIKILLAKELARLDEIMRVCWEAWDQSKMPQEVQTQEKVLEEAQQSAKVSAASKNREWCSMSNRQETRDGNPAFLRLIMDTIDRRCKLLGLNSDSIREFLRSGETQQIRFIEVVKPQKAVCTLSETAK